MIPRKIFSAHPCNTFCGGSFIYLCVLIVPRCLFCRKLQMCHLFLCGRTCGWKSVWMATNWHVGWDGGRWRWLCQCGPGVWAVDVHWASKGAPVFITSYYLLSSPYRLSSSDSFFSFICVTVVKLIFFRLHYHPDVINAVRSLTGQFLGQTSR